jgi:hypothetical protein
LSKGKNLKKEDMQAISSYLGQLKHSSNLQSDVIRATKIRRALMEILKLKVIPSESEFKFKSRFERLLKRCNKALDREKLLAGDMEQPLEPLLKSADEDDCSTAGAKKSTPDSGIGKASSVLAESRIGKRKPKDHVTVSNKRRTCKLFLTTSELGLILH